MPSSSSEREREERRLLDSSEEGSDEDDDEEDEEVAETQKGEGGPPRQSPDEEEDVDIEEILVTNSFKVDVIAEYGGSVKDDLILHWGISKKDLFQWTGPDDRYLPLETVRFQDGKSAAQTKFIRDAKTPTLRAVHLNFWWKEAMEPAVKSLSFVLFEP